MVEISIIKTQGKKQLVVVSDPLGVIKSKELTLLNQFISGDVDKSFLLAVFPSEVCFKTDFDLLDEEKISAFIQTAIRDDRAKRIASFEKESAKIQKRLDSKGDDIGLNCVFSTIDKQLNALKDHL